MTRQVARIYKLDSQTSKLISGAEFKLEKYVNGLWTTVSDDYKLTGNDDNWNSDWGPDSSSDDRRLAVGRLYRLTETNAPKGYAKSEAEYLFAFIKGSSTKDTIALPSDVAKKMSGISMAPARISWFQTDLLEVRVKKVWLKADGTPIPNPPAINVALVRDYNGCEVTIRSQNSWNPGNYLFYRIIQWH